jgi:hypothetical protein
VRRISVMTCKELLQRFIEALERDDVDLEALRKLANKCGLFFAREAGKAFAKKVVNYYMSFAWRYYKGAAIAGKPPKVAYGEAVLMIWRLWDWYSIHCGPLGDIATYIAEAAPAAPHLPRRTTHAAPAATTSAARRIQLSACAA